MEQMATLTVLIVDDDEDAAEVQAAELRDYGLNVVVVTDSTKAIAKMKEIMPHLVILDLEMPQKSGVDILWDMSLEPELRDMPVVGNSVHMDPKDNLGTQFYQTFVYLRNKEPNFVNKLAPSEAMWNNLTALVGIELAQRYRLLPKALAQYLDDFKNKGAEK